MPICPASVGTIAATCILKSHYQNMAILRTGRLVSRGLTRASVVQSPRPPVGSQGWQCEQSSLAVPEHDTEQLQHEPTRYNR